MATAISNMFSFGTHERLPTDEELTSQNSIVEVDDDEEAAASTAGVTADDPLSGVDMDNSGVPDVVPVSSDDEAEELRPTTTTSSSSGGGDVETGEAEDDDDEANTLTATIPRLSGRAATAAGGTVTLTELEEERELARRRTSACVLLAVFVLFRLWIEALQNGDFFVMMLCLFGTSWTARLIRHNREREEALDERIRVYLENADPNTTEIDRNELRFLSFQAQLALAMMESQRQMQQGGYGHPDGHNGGSGGVSDDAKSKWEHFAYKDGVEEGEASSSSSSTKKGGYGSVAQNEQTVATAAAKGGLEEDGPHCSICLGEYEDGEKLVKLPGCGHIYHDDCVSSWTTNHTRCPLCNLDLESVTSEAQSLPEDSMV